MFLKLLPRVRALARLLIALALAMGGLLFQPPAIGSAHAALVKAEPAPLSTLTRPPLKVTIWASEPINPRFSSLQVFDSRRQRVDLDNSSVVLDDPRRMEVGLQPLKEDTYTVLWTFNSRFDGHTLRGTYSFAVNFSALPVFSQESVVQSGGASTGSTIRVWSSANVVHTIAQWLMLLTALLIVGSLLFRIIVPRVLGIQGHADLGSMLVEWQDARWAGTERLLAVSLPVSTIIATMATIASAGNSWGSVFSPSFIRNFIAGTPVGIATIIKIILSLIIAVVLFVHGTRYVALSVSLFFLVLVAFTGHARAVDQPLFIPIVLDWVHLVAASAWFGGMVFAVRGLLPVGDGKKKVFVAWQQFVLVLNGFSPVALTSIGLLLATGFYNSVTRLSSPGNLLSSGFGLLLLAKMMAVAVMIFLGYLNAFVTRPRFKIAQEKHHSNQMPLVVKLRRLLVWEPIFGVIAVMVTATLAAYPPPGLVPIHRDTTPQPPVATPQTPASTPASAPRFSLGQRAEDLLVILKVGPGDVARNRISVSLAQAVDGRPLRVATLVRLRATFLEQESGSQFITTEAQSDGSFLGDADFSFKGLWKVEVIVRRQDKADVATSFQMVIPATDATAVLARAEVTMNSLRSLNQHEELDDRIGPVQVTDAEFQAPDRVHFRNLTRGREVYIIGKRQFLQESGGKWREGPGLGATPFTWPAFNLRQGWVQPVIVGSETLDGQPHTIVATFDSVARFHYLLWIGKEDYMVRRWHHLAPGHFVEDRFSGFNSTTIPVAETELPR